MMPIEIDSSSVPRELAPDATAKSISSGTEGDKLVEPSLVELALDATITNFGKFSFRPEAHLRPDIASTFTSRIPLPRSPTLETLATNIDNDEYWKGALNPKGRVSSEDNCQSNKSMYLEQNLQIVLEEGPEEIVSQLKPIADHINLLKLCGTRKIGPNLLYTIIPMLKNLTSIHLKQAASLTRSIPKAIASSSFLTTLTLTESQISDDNLLSILENDLSTTLLHLDLSHNKLTSKGINTIVDKLIASPESILSYLDLAGNKISSEGAAAIGKSLATNDSLLTLNLRLNAIEDGGGRNFFQGLEQNSTLRRINLSANELGAGSVATLLEVLEKKSEDCSLDSIVLTSNSFTDEECASLSRCKVCFIDVRSKSSDIGVQAKRPTPMHDIA